MKKITFDSAHRRRHFEYFNAMAVPYFSVTAPLRVGPLVRHSKQLGARLHVALAYLMILNTIILN